MNYEVAFVGINCSPSNCLFVVVFVSWVEAVVVELLLKHFHLCDLLLIYFVFCTVFITSHFPIIAAVALTLHDTWLCRLLFCFSAVVFVVFFNSSAVSM